MTDENNNSENLEPDEVLLEIVTGTIGGAILGLITCLGFICFASFMIVVLVAAGFKFLILMALSTLCCAFILPFILLLACKRNSEEK